MNEKLDRLLQRHEELAAQMSGQDFGDAQAFVRASKEYADLTPVVEAIQALRAAEREAEGLEELLGAQDGDEEMRALAQEELPAVREAIGEHEHRLKILLLPKDAADEKNAILEIRAGTGGDEAALFAADLFRMYQRYSELHGWRLALMQTTETGIGGFKEAIAEISGTGVFARLKFESGVHRVQRVPETESSGRIHTSAATVAVLPEAEDCYGGLNLVNFDLDTTLFVHFLLNLCVDLREPFIQVNYRLHGFCCYRFCRKVDVTQRTRGFG